MRKLRIGLCGAGLVGQAEHAYFLWEDSHLFEFVALADASQAVRQSVGNRYGIAKLCGTLDELLTCDLDAVVIAVPDAFHADFAVAAFEAGLHVLCEKPLALTLADCDRMIAARDKAKRVGMTAYMKRYDPTFRAALRFLPAIDQIRLITVEVNDPDHEPFVAHLPIEWPRDIPQSLSAELANRTRAQLDSVAGCPVSDEARRALANGFLSAIVHDVAVIHGFLIHLGVELPVHADFGARFDEGRGVQLGFPLPGGGRVSMIHLNLPGVPDYCERIAVYGTDRIIELTFQSPYLRHAPTRLTIRRSGDGGVLEIVDVRTNFEEAFREELRAFHAAVTAQTPISTTFEQARRDFELLSNAFRRTVA